MDFSQVIISLLGLQGVSIEDFKEFKKQRKIEIRVRQNRGDCFCPHCGLQFSRVKDCDRTAVACRLDTPRFGSLTCGFAEVAGRLMEEITCEAVARILHSTSKTMWELDQFRMEMMLRFMTLPKDLDVSYLCADEVPSILIKHLIKPL